jgi:hypothetical protein
MRQSTLILAVLAVAAGCAPKQEQLDTTPLPAVAVACQEPYVEIINRTSKPLDIYQYVGGIPLLVGQVSSTTNRLSLIGTPAERQYGAMYATVDGQRVSQAAGSAKNTGSVQLTRKCAKSS